MALPGPGVPSGGHPIELGVGTSARGRVAGRWRGPWWPPMVDDGFRGVGLGPSEQVGHEVGAAPLPRLAPAREDCGKCASIWKVFLYNIEPVSRPVSSTPLECKLCVTASGRKASQNRMPSSRYGTHSRSVPMISRLSLDQLTAVSHHPR